VIARLPCWRCRCATPLIVDFARIWRDMPKVVFSRTLESVDWNSRLERRDPVEVVTKLKAETDGTLEVAGATLAAPIVQAGLLDEYRLVVAPTAVGGGTPFFPTLPSWISCDCWRIAPSRVARSCCATRRNATDRTHTARRAADTLRDTRLLQRHPVTAAALSCHLAVIAWYCDQSAIG
jgi:dihydrofolate reductase